MYDIEHEPLVFSKVSFTVIRCYLLLNWDEKSTQFREVIIDMDKVPIIPYQWC